MKKEDYSKLSVKEKNKVPFSQLPKDAKIGVIVIIALLIILPFYCFRSGCGDDKTVKNDHKAGAYLASQDFVKLQIKYPEEANFAWAPKYSQQINDSTYKIVGELTAKNAFGVKSKIIYKCTMVYKGGDDMDTNSWETNDLEINEQ